MGFIQYERVNNVVLSVEKVFEVNNMDIHEQEFLISMVLSRIRKKVEGQRMSDMLSNNVSGGLIKSLMKKVTRGDDEDESA